MAETRLLVALQGKSIGHSNISFWRLMLVCLGAVFLFAGALWLLLHNLDVPIARDYDEGVYWQTLRAMAGGRGLYDPVFYSQPPFFMFSVFPTYLLLGETITAARLGIVVVSLVGLLGAFVLGKALAGYLGAAVAVVLVVTDPLYLTLSQTLQAEIPCIAFSLLSVALAYTWSIRPLGRAGLLLAASCGVALSLGCLSKLLGFSSAVPIGVIILLRWWRLPAGQRADLPRVVGFGVGFFILMSVVVLLPFVGSLTELWQGVVVLHLDAEIAYAGQQQGNAARILPYLRDSLITYVALYGIAVAAFRRDWRVVPLIGWLLATVFLLWRQTPLQAHHIAVLAAPLAAIAVIGIGGFLPVRKYLGPRTTRLTVVAWSVAMLLVAATAAQGIANSWHRFEAEESLFGSTNDSLAAALDLSGLTQGDHLVITDGQFEAALADRDTPAALVDTSFVRVTTRFLTDDLVIAEASRPEVGAVLFWSPRLREGLPRFYSWVSTDYLLAKEYGGGRELWVRK